MNFWFACLRWLLCLLHPRGQIYSLNDARFDDWPAGLQRYISAVRSGAGQTGKQYSARYVVGLDKLNPVEP
jgi:fructose-1,6-bisphosphatase